MPASTAKPGRPPRYRVSEVATLLGVSDDTVRRWIDGGRLTSHKEGGRQTLDGVEVAALARDLAKDPAAGAVAPTSVTSTRNHLTGIVTDVVRDTVMAKVELQAGPYRLVSLMSREAADELGLVPGVVATAAVKATNVVIERFPS